MPCSCSCSCLYSGSVPQHSRPVEQFDVHVSKVMRHWETAEDLWSGALLMGEARGNSWGPVEWGCSNGWWRRCTDSEDQSRVLEMLGFFKGFGPHRKAEDVWVSGGDGFTGRRNNRKANPFIFKRHECEGVWILISFQCSKLRDIWPSMNLNQVQKGKALKQRPNSHVSASQKCLSFVTESHLSQCDLSLNTIWALPMPVVNGRHISSGVSSIALFFIFSFHLDVLGFLPMWLSCQIYTVSAAAGARGPEYTLIPNDHIRSTTSMSLHPI